MVAYILNVQINEMLSSALVTVWWKYNCYDKSVKRADWFKENSRAITKQK